MLQRAIDDCSMFHSTCLFRLCGSPYNRYWTRLFLRPLTGRALLQKSFLIAEDRAYWHVRYSGNRYCSSQTGYRVRNAVGHNIHYARSEANPFVSIAYTWRRCMSLKKSFSPCSGQELEMLSQIFLLIAEEK